LAQVRSWLFGHTVASLPFCVYGGVATTDPRVASALTAEAERLARLLGAHQLELRHREPHNPEWPRQDLYVTFRKEMLPEPEANMLAIPRKQRAMVRKGIKAGLRSELDEGPDRFFRLYAGNVHRHGTPALPRRYFEALRRTFGRDCEVLTIVDSSGTPVSSVLSFYFRFDYGRSKRGTGSFDFKKNWGFEPTPLHYEYRLFRGQEIPQNNPANPKYKAFIAVWRKLPLPLANALGPYIVRNLG
jgi:hypothetical protein